MRRPAASMRTSRILLGKGGRCDPRTLNSLSRLGARLHPARNARRSAVCGVESPGRMSTARGIPLRSLDFVAMSEIMREPERVHVVRSNVSDHEEDAAPRRRSSRSPLSRAFDLIAIAAVAIVL